MSQHIIVVGAGLAGLAVAIATRVANPEHKVTVLEAVSEIRELGAGLQLTPNSTRLFKTWGIYDELEGKATVPQTLSVYRYDGTKTLAHETDFEAKIQQQYGAPFWGMHRVDLQRAMVARAEALGVTFRLSARVTSIDFEAVTVTLDGGERISGDVVVCADGLWSGLRGQFLSQESKAILTGDLAYRIVLNVNDLHGAEKEELAKWVRDRRVSFWAGPKSHVVGYSLRREEIYNLVLLCPDDLPEGVRKTDGDLEEMRELFVGWDPALTRWLGQVQKVEKWRLMHLDALPVWANDQGTFLMVGDCCHPMLPYLAQGANSSLEDGAVLGYLLGKVNAATKEHQLPVVAKLYQELRKARGEGIQRETVKQRHDFHLEDGAEQEARDLLMESMLGGELRADFPSRWTCPRVQKWLYGYDSYAEVEKACTAIGF